MSGLENGTVLPDRQITKDDAAWVLANAFLILTMQTGFGMLEAGCVSPKNVANIMVKNVVDVTVGGMTYWIFGYALSFGRPSNAFCGYGDFFFTVTDTSQMGTLYTKYVFQFSFATAATTIVSGAVAERMKLTSYILFSAINTFVYCVPVSWAWHDTGFLKKLHFFDFAGACVVHLTGGCTALIAAVMLGPRLGRFSHDSEEHSLPSTMSSPVTALTGTFMLWWAWLAFNCGSTFGIAGHLWKTAAKVGVTTLNGSIGGSLAGLLLSVLVNWRDKYFDIQYIITSVLAGLISVTAGSSVFSPAESVIIGAIGGAAAIGFLPVLEKLKIDDPVGAIPVHFVAAMWATIAVGVFGEDEFYQLKGYNGLFHGGGLHLLGIQGLGIICMMVWSMLTTFLTFLAMKYTIGIRMSPENEILGADWVEHRVRSENFAIKLEKALSALKIDDQEADAVALKVLQEIMNARNDGQQGRRNVDYFIRNMAGPGAPGPSRMESCERPVAWQNVGHQLDTANPASVGVATKGMTSLKGQTRMYDAFVAKSIKTTTKEESLANEDQVLDIDGTAIEKKRQEGSCSHVKHTKKSRF